MLEIVGEPLRRGAGIAFRVVLREVIWCEFTIFVNDLVGLRGKVGTVGAVGVLVGHGGWDVKCY